MDNITLSQTQIDAMKQNSYSIARRLRVRPLPTSGEMTQEDAFTATQKNLLVPESKRGTSLDKHVRDYINAAVDETVSFGPKRTNYGVQLEDSLIGEGVVAGKATARELINTIDSVVAHCCTPEASRGAGI